MPPPTKTRSSSVLLLRLTLMCLCLFGVVITHRQTASTSDNSTDAQQAIEHGDALCASWTQTALRAAIAEYERAAQLSTSHAAQANLKSGEVLFILNDYNEALKRYQNAELLASKADDWLTAATAFSRIGRVHSFLGRNELANQQLTKAFDLFKQHNADRTDLVANAYGEALTNQAEVSYAIGDFVTAREQLKKALEVFRNDPKGAAKAHLYNAYISGSLGDAEAALTEINLAVDLYRKANDKIGEGIALSTLGLSYSLKRDVNGATELHNQAIKIFRLAGDRYDEAIALNGVGQAYEGVGEYVLAINQYEQSVRIFEEIGSADGLITPTFKLGRVHNLSGHPDKALEFFGRCLQLCRAAGKVRTEAYVLSEIARVYVAQGRRDLAKQQFLKLQKFYESLEDFRGQATALIPTAISCSKAARTNKRWRFGNELCR